MKSITFAGVLATALAMGCGGAWAEITECTQVVSLPATISVPGVYCLKQDLSSNATVGAAITVAANSVTLDMNGWKLGGTGAGASTLASGIYVNNMKNFTLRNGIIRGFFVGLQIVDNGSSSGHLIEDMAFDENNLKGVDITGSNYTFRRNRITKTIARHPVQNIPVGAFLQGSSASIADNFVSHVEGASANGTGPTGMHLYALSDSVIERNQITKAVVTTVGVNPRAYGINVGSTSSNLILRENTILEVQHVDGRGIDLVAGDEILLDGNVVKNKTVTGAIGIRVQATNVSCSRNYVRGYVDAMEPCDFELANVTP